jgi:hypothetical protein
MHCRRCAGDTCRRRSRRSCQSAPCWRLHLRCRIRNPDSRSYWCVDVQVAYAGVPAKCEASSLLNTFDPSWLTKYSCPVTFRYIPRRTYFRRPNGVRCHRCILIRRSLRHKSIPRPNSPKTQPHYRRVVPLSGPWSCYGIPGTCFVHSCKCRFCSKILLLGTRTIRIPMTVTHEI